MSTATDSWRMIPETPPKADRSLGMLLSIQRKSLSETATEKQLNTRCTSTHSYPQTLGSAAKVTNHPPSHPSHPSLQNQATLTTSTATFTPGSQKMRPAKAAYMQPGWRAAGREGAIPLGAFSWFPQVLLGCSAEPAGQPGSNWAAVSGGLP